MMRTLKRMVALLIMTVANVIRQLRLEFFRYTERLRSSNKGMPSLILQMLRFQFLFHAHEDPLK